MLLFAKAICITIYALALATLAGYFPELGKYMQLAALALIVAHAIEVVAAFKYVRRHPGSLAASIALTMLFGLLHWRRYMGQPAKA